MIPLIILLTLIEYQYLSGKYQIRYIDFGLKCKVIVGVESIDV